MTSIGIRASNNEIYYTVLQKTDEDVYSITSLSYLMIPVSLSFPEKLNFIRKTFKDIIFEFSVNRAGIRIAESVAQSISIERISYEAILQEVLSSSSIEKYITGQISNISSRLGIQRDNFKKIISGEITHDIFDPEKKYNQNEKEAILVGLAALNL